ncbi:MAG: Na+/H+ antiporter subunit C [Dehalococcoidia bacterium]|nr:Na+/H+ antiporter subunit C [Dehalococcoidia bacterium]
METLLAFVVGGLFSVAVYLMLRRSLAQIILGLGLLTNAVNLMIFTVGGLTPGDPPLIAEGSDTPPPVYANPVPQALILTAIVIGFGVLALALVLAYRAYYMVRSDDPDAMRSTDQLGPPDPN